MIEDAGPPMAKSLNFSITSKTLPNEDIIATVEDAVKDLEKEEADTIRAKVSLTLQNSKPRKDNLSKDERKALKELQSDTSIVILPAYKGRSAIILNREDYLEKCMDHINNGPYQLLKKDPTTKIKTKTLKQLKVLKDYYYYLELNDSPSPRLYGQPKIHKPGVPIPPIVSYSAPCCTISTNTWLTFSKLMLEIKITTPRILPRFPNTSEMFPLKMMR